MYRKTALLKEELSKIIVIPGTLSYLPVYSAQPVVPFWDYFTVTHTITVSISLVSFPFIEQEICSLAFI